MGRRAKARKREREKGRSRGRENDRKRGGEKGRKGEMEKRLNEILRFNSNHAGVGDVRGFKTAQKHSGYSYNNKISIYKIFICKF